LVERQTFEGKEWKKLPLDTRHFGIGFKIRLLEALSEGNDLDEILDGILIKSENWQALNLLLGKFEGKVQCIYIDPPFNTGTNEFLYKNNYLDSSWASMMYDRLQSGEMLLDKTGSIYVRIDYHGNHYVRMLMDNVFGKQNFKNEIIINRTKKVFEGANRFITANDSLFVHSKSEGALFNIAKKERGEQKWIQAHSPGIRWSEVSEKYLSYYKPSQLKLEKGKYYSRGRVFKGKVCMPPNGRHWTFSQERLEEYDKEGRIRLNEKGILEYLTSPLETVDSNWTDIPGYVVPSKWGFPTENSEQLLQRVIETSSNKGDFVLDYFLGSGTTTAVAHKLGRKWIGVEMGDYFDNIPLKRMKAVLAGEQSGISKEVNWKGGGFFKYHYVEQYEDTLSNIVFLEKDKTVQETLDEFGDYLLKNMLEFETRGSPTRLNVEQFQTPFDYKIWVTTAGEKRLATVDLVETFNYLLGITVEKFRTFKNQEREYRCIFGKLNQENIAIIWRNTKDLDLKKDKEFIENTILAGTKPDRIFINGDSLLEKAEPIEPEFKRLMGA
jgi:adenine-specific DNA-methyltransferase